MPNKADLSCLNAWVVGKAGRIGITMARIGYFSFQPFPHLAQKYFFVGAARGIQKRTNIKTPDQADLR